MDYTKNEIALINLISNLNKEFYYFGEEDDLIPSPRWEIRETVDKFVQNAVIDRQRAVQNASSTQINTQSSEAVLNSRVEVAPDIDVNQARNRYQETSAGPTNIPENYTQVALDA